MAAASFQFPLAERTSCNVPYRLQQRKQVNLSVSSSGTNELQRTSRRIIQSSMLSLSVSSSGTNELQHGVHAAHGRNVRPFQFPLAERTSCNKVVVIRHPFPSDLSVSSSGTNELQLAHSRPRGIGSQLSVSSSGTNELQLTPSLTMFASIRTFSFL